MAWGRFQTTWTPYAVAGTVKPRTQLRVHESKSTRAVSHNQGGQIMKLSATLALAGLAAVLMTAPAAASVTPSGITGASPATAASVRAARSTSRSTRSKRTAPTWESGRPPRGMPTRRAPAFYGLAADGAPRLRSAPRRIAALTSPVVSRARAVSLSCALDRRHHPRRLVLRRHEEVDGLRVERARELLQLGHRRVLEAAFHPAHPVHRQPGVGGEVFHRHAVRHANALDVEREQLVL